MRNQVGVQLRVSNLNKLQLNTCNRIPSSFAHQLHASMAFFLTFPRDGQCYSLSCSKEVLFFNFKILFLIWVISNWTLVPYNSGSNCAPNFKSALSSSDFEIVYLIPSLNCTPLSPITVTNCENYRPPKMQYVRRICQKFIITRQNYGYHYTVTTANGYWLVGQAIIFMFLSREIDKVAGSSIFLNSKNSLLRNTAIEFYQCRTGF